MVRVTWKLKTINSWVKPRTLKRRGLSELIRSQSSGQHSLLYEDRGRLLYETVNKEVLVTLCHADKDHAPHNSWKIASNASSMGPWTAPSKREFWAHTIRQIKVFEAAWCSHKPGNRVTVMVGRWDLDRSSQSPAIAVFWDRVLYAPGCYWSLLLPQVPGNRMLWLADVHGHWQSSFAEVAVNPRSPSSPRKPRGAQTHSPSLWEWVTGQEGWLNVSWWLSWLSWQPLKCVCKWGRPRYQQSHLNIK